MVPLMLAGCATKVTHPTKSASEMQADIKLCTDEANRRYWMDPVAALYNAYDCLEAKGYQRSHSDVAAQVEQAVGERPAAKPSSTEPCQVPCKPRQ